MNGPQRPFVLAALAFLTVALFGAAAYVFLGSRSSGESDQRVDPLPLGQAPQALRLTILEDGIASISAEKLRQINFPVETISAETVALSRDGNQVPFVVVGEGRNATLYFFAQATTDTLEAPAVYWLSPGVGTLMEAADVSPAGTFQEAGRRVESWEENEIFLAQSSGSDVWLGKLLFAPSSIDIPLDGIQPTGGPGQLTVRIWSNNQADADPDHHVEILLNGQKLTDRYWDGIKEETIQLEIGDGVLLPEGNLLTINAPGDTGAAGEALYLDWIEMAYEGHLDASEGALRFESNAANLRVRGVGEDALLFDISDPHTPALLTGAKREGNGVAFLGRGPDTSYYVTSESDTIEPRLGLVPSRSPLTGPGRGADYLAIVADVEGFAEAVRPLLAYREERGMQVTLVTASQVFDEFGYGRQTPEAIRDFLAYAHAEWQPAPEFVLLVGDATYDIYNYSEGKNQNLMPTFLVFTEFAGLVASDTWFTIFEEGGLSPEMAIGRLPAQTAEQLETMVEKTLAYEQAADEEWLGRALLVADDEPSFDHASDDLASTLGETGYETQKLYMTQDENIHDAIVSALNQGVGIINYVGHGSIEVWGDERVFQAEDAEILFNGQRLPIFTTFTCLNGYFNHPGVDALAETLLWAEDGGVVASVAPSGRSLTTQQLPLADVFYERLLSGEASTLGRALQVAKVAGSGDTFLNDVIHTFNLLGDPALRFRLPG